MQPACRARAFLCKGAPATSSHARAEWARSIEYRVGPIIIAVGAQFGGHNALRWVPEEAESDVSGRSRRPTVPAECGYPGNDRRRPVRKPSGELAFRRAKLIPGVARGAGCVATSSDFDAETCCRSAHAAIPHTATGPADPDDLIRRLSALNTSCLGARHLRRGRFGRFGTGWSAP